MQVCSAPGDISEIIFPDKIFEILTATGNNLFVVVPSPIFPLLNNLNFFF
jgi:hypothetical protein